MAYFSGRRGSTSSSAASSDDDRDDFSSNFPVHSSPDGARLDGVSGAAPRKKHAFLKSESETMGHEDGHEAEDGKLQSKYERCVENIDDNVAELAQGRGNKNWKVAHTKWLEIQADLRYVAANGKSLPYSFLSTLADTKAFFEKHSMQDLREETSRDQRKHLADFQRDLTVAYEYYKAQIEHMDETDESSDDDDRNDDEVQRKISNAVFSEGEHISEELVAKRLAEIRSTYGKKGTKRNVYADQLLEILNATEAFPRVQAMMSSLLVSVNLDAARKSGALSPKKWYEAAKHLETVLRLMKMHPNTVQESARVQRSHPSSYKEVDPVKEKEKELNEAFYLPITASALASRMLEEYLDGVRNTEVYADTYLLWLKAESALVKIIQQARGLYLQIREASDQICQLTMNLLELIYYRQQMDHTNLIDKYGTYDIVVRDLTKSVHALNDYIQKNTKGEEMKFHATLCVIYHLALHQEIEGAVAIFTSTRASDRVTQITDASVRLMYNRVLAQLCIAHFRSGNLQEAGNTVMNLFSLPKYRELLGQVLPRTSGKDRVEKALRSRFVPRHMHLNAEMLDVVFYLFCMIYRPKDTRIFVYRQFLAGYDRQQFLGPPENSRECVYAAVKAFREADWHKCERHIRAIPVWGALANDLTFLQPILSIVRVECLKTFILQSKGSYLNIHVHHMSERFNVPIELIRFTISQMLLNRDVSGVWDAEENFLHLETTTYTTVEQSLLDLADKATMLTEFTEKVQDTHEGGNSHHRTDHRRGGNSSRAPIARQLMARNPFASLRGGAGTRGAGSRGRGTSMRGMIR